MILRFQSRIGQFRLEVQPHDEFPSLLPKVVEKLPQSVDPSSITVSNKPQGGDARRLVGLKGVSFQRIGLRLVTLSMSREGIAI